MDQFVFGETKAFSRYPGRLIGEAADVDFDPAFGGLRLAEDIG